MARKSTVRPADLHTSTAYSRARYAHPFYLPSPPEAQPQPYDGLEQNHLGPVPKVAGDGVMDLADIIGADGVNRNPAAWGNSLTRARRQRRRSCGGCRKGRRRYGDRLQAGRGLAQPGVSVSPRRRHLWSEQAGALRRTLLPAVSPHPGKIIAIPGNHDGETKSAADKPSLNAFRANFCARSATVPEQAAGSGIYRQTMIEILGVSVQFSLGHTTCPTDCHCIGPHFCVSCCLTTRGWRKAVCRHVEDGLN